MITAWCVLIVIRKEAVIKQLLFKLTFKREILVYVLFAFVFGGD